uniref:Uncharacterized protein n=1 Tax=Hyaloperonospora arabidopsidis (strain Emoy2) TaxID=559515 RepID=M4BUZ3_HYAAE
MAREMIGFSRSVAGSALRQLFRRNYMATTNQRSARLRVRRLHKCRSSSTYNLYSCATFCAAV